MHLKADFAYIECRTLTGKRLIVGLKNERAYIQINKNFLNDFHSLYKKLNLTNHNLLIFNDKEKMLISIFEKKGFFEGYDVLYESFNEYSSFSKIFFKKKLSNSRNIEIQNIKLFYVLYLSIWLIATIYLLKILMSFDFELMHINLRGVSVLEWGIIILIIPTLIYGIHELGHFIIAKLLGIEVFRIMIGFFVCWPTIYLEYRGLNLNSTLNKLSVISAGILTHVIGACVGLMLIQNMEGNIILNIWTTANLSMIVTNIIFIGPNDGYFLLSNAVGIYNLRYKGYKALNKLFIKNNTTNVTSEERICGFLLIILWIFSFYGIFITFLYYGEILGIPNQMVYVGTIIILLILFLRFFSKIFKLNIE